jgi:hypothetical protein
MPGGAKAYRAAPLGGGACRFSVDADVQGTDFPHCSKLRSLGLEFSSRRLRSLMPAGAWRTHQRPSMKAHFTSQSRQMWKGLPGSPAVLES